MKRTPLKRKTPLRRRPMRRRRIRRIPGDVCRAEPDQVGNRYALRDRADAFMSWVRTRPCTVSRIGLAGIVNHVLILGLPCSGPVQADHAGERIAGMSTKCMDRDCIAMCLRHHEDRTNSAGIFEPMTKEQRREWRRAAIDYTHTIARARGVEIPEC